MVDPFRAAVAVPARAPLNDRAPRVLAYVHNYPPNQNAGAEWMLHELLVGARARGLDVRVLAARVGRDWQFEGIDVFGAGSDRRRAQLVGWSDVVLTHLDMTRDATTLAQRGARPVVHLLHNDRQLEFHRVKPAEVGLLVANSEWIAAHYRAWPVPMIVVRPPVDPARYRTTPGQRVTLVNLNAEKGGHLFWKLAARLPARQFLAVRGGYGDQIGFPMVRSLADVKRAPRNVAFQWPTANMRDDVYARTRVLLMPSAYESWGRVAVEAMVSGIPVVAHPTPGLLESLGEAGVFVDRKDVDGWVDAVERLHGQAAWESWSRKASTRSRELDPTDDLDLFAASVDALARGLSVADQRA